MKRNGILFILVLFCIGLIGCDSPKSPEEIRQATATAQAEMEEDEYAAMIDEGEDVIDDEGVNDTDQDSDVVEEPPDVGVEPEDLAPPADSVGLDVVCSASYNPGEFANLSCSQSATYEFSADDGAEAQSQVSCTSDSLNGQYHCSYKSDTEDVETYVDNAAIYFRTGDQWALGESDDITSTLNGYTTLFVDTNALIDMGVSDWYSFTVKQESDAVRVLESTSTNTSNWEYLTKSETDDVVVLDGVETLTVVEHIDGPTYVNDIKVIMNTTVNDTPAQFKFVQETVVLTQTLTLSPPTVKEMSGLPEDMAIYPVFTNATISPGQIYMVTNDPLPDVLDFYTNNLNNNGYELTNQLGSIEVTPVYAYWSSDTDSIVVIMDLYGDAGGTQMWVQNAEQ